MMVKIDSFDGPFHFLSNFYPCWVNYEGILYPSSEHAFQAAKTLDMEKRKDIAALATPAQSKRHGRKLELRSDWESKRIQIMKDILKIKFQDKELKEKLLDTNNAQLIEGNTWGDEFWGVCKGRGKNNLGILLMEIRKEFRAIG